MKTPPLILAIFGWAAWALPSSASGPVLLVHGHADTPALWTVQGAALARASGDSRFYDPRWYYAGELPARFESNGIYGVTYYSRTSADPIQPAPISPVRIGASGQQEVAPDEAWLEPFLYGQSDSYAARLAAIINRAAADTKQRVTLVCHSMGGLVSLSTVAWFGASTNVERIVTIGSPLRGFPPDFRVPAEIFGLGRTNLFREGLQMSEGVKYDGVSFSEMLESRIKRFLPGVSIVNIVGTLSPLPDDLLTGQNDGVVRSADQRFRDSSLASVYELPLVHNENFRVVRYPAEDVECLSSRTTHVLEKEVLGLDPVPRLGTALSFNYGTHRIRVTVRNEGGLPVTFSELSGRFEFLGKQGRIATDPLGDLKGRTLLPGQSLTAESLLMQRGERGDVRLVLTVNGRELPPGEATFVANIQAPEVEVSVRYDLANAQLRSQWDMLDGSKLWPVTWNASYRLEGNIAYDPASKHLIGSLSTHLYGSITGAVTSLSTNLFYAESFDFDLDPLTRIFSEVGGAVLGTNSIVVGDATASRLRELYRVKLLPLVTTPGPFVIEGSFSATAGLTLERPVVRYDAETHGVALELRGTLVFTFRDGGRERLVQIPVKAACSTTFLTDRRGLVMKPRVQTLSLGGLSLSENYRKQLNQIIESHDFVVVPTTFSNSINSSARDALISYLGASAVPTDWAPFDSPAVAVEATPTRLRLLIDLYDDATHQDQNSYAGVPENGIAFQDRLVNELLDRSRPLINAGLARSGLATFPIGYEFPISPNYSPEFFAPSLIGPSGFFGLEAFNLYLDKARIEVSTKHYREFQILFLGPENRTHLDLPIDASFDLQLRQYFAVRIGFSVFGKFYGYTKRWRILSVPWTERWAVNFDATLYPYARNAVDIVPLAESQTIYTNQGAAFGVNYRVRDLGIETDFANSSLLAGSVGLLLVDPLFRLAKDNPRLFTTVGGAAIGGLVFGLFPDVAASRATGKGAAKLLEHSRNPYIKQLKDGLEDGSVSIDFHIRDQGVGPQLALAGALLGGWAGNAFLTREVESILDTPRSLGEKFVPLPPDFRLTKFEIGSGAASLGLDLEPSYGDLMVTSIVGLNATNGIVPLTLEDLVFDVDSNSRFGLTYTEAGEFTRFTSLWVKKPVSKIRLAMQYAATYAARYNTSEYPGYTLKYAQADQGAFAVPTGFAYDQKSDTVSFTLDVPVLEGVGSLHALRLELPGNEALKLPFLAGKDTSPLLIDHPFAAYSAASGEVQITAGAMVYRNPGTLAPSFSLEELKLLKPAGAFELVNLKPRGTTATNLLTPSANSIGQVYGADFSWTGNLPAGEFPEGLYTALVTLSETSLKRKGALLIPLMIDRTPPELEVRAVDTNQTVVSRHLSLPLVWQLDDQYSAVMHDVNLTYMNAFGIVSTGAVFAANNEVLISGRHRFDFVPDMARVPDGVEEAYTLQIHATDVPGNRGVSADFNFLVDTKPPTLQASSLFPAGFGDYHAVITESNRLLTLKLECIEPFTARILLQNTNNGATQDWVVTSIPAGSQLHRAVWVLDLPPVPPDQGILEGVVSDGVHRLSIELVDRGNNTTNYPNYKTILVDRQPPVLSFKSQQTFVPSGRTVYPIDLNTSSMGFGDLIESIALVSLKSGNSAPSGEPNTLRTWRTASEIAAVLTAGIPLDPVTRGLFLAPGYYGVEVIARDLVGNRTRVTTQFGFQFLPPHIEVQGTPNASGIVPIGGIAVDPNPADRFAFTSRKLYWAFGTNVPAPANLDKVDPAIWRDTGIYVLPPRGPGMANAANTSSEMVPQGVLGYWNTTATALALEGDITTTVTAAAIRDRDVTLLLVVTDIGGQAWAGTTSVHVDNRTDIAGLSLPGVQILNSAVRDHQLKVDAALLRDTPALQMLVVSPNGAVVHRTSLSAVESRNKLLGRPLSLENDFGIFAWYDEAARQLRVRCVSPERSSQGAVLTRGHTFHFSLRGDFGTNDLHDFQLAASEKPEGVRLRISTNGSSRVSYDLDVAPGTEKRVDVDYRGGVIELNAIGIDDYFQVLYENGPVVEKRFWRVEDQKSIFPGYLGVSTVRNLVGLDGTVMNGIAIEPEDSKAFAHHTGVVGHYFVGRSRCEPISPLSLALDSTSIQSDVSLAWDLKLPDGSFAEPGNYQVYLYAIDDQANRFHGAHGTAAISAADVPFRVTGLNLARTGSFNPVGDGGLILNFNATRSATATVRIVNASNQVVATIADAQSIAGRTDTNAPHQVWWDGYVNGAPALAGKYAFELSFVADGVTTNFQSRFSVAYPASLPRESNWELLTQPIAFDPDTKDRIVRDPRGFPFNLNDRAWVTLRFQAKLSDGTTAEAERQVGLELQGDRFESMITDTKTKTYVAVSPLFGDAVQRLERIQVKFNDRVVDVFPPVDPRSTNKVPSRSGQFIFQVLDPGPEALRLQVILRGRLKRWMEGLAFALNETNGLFIADQVREFKTELEFRDKADGSGTLRSLPWNLHHEERLIGYVATNGVLVPYHGHAVLVLDNLSELEIRDRNGKETLARFNGSQIREGGASEVEQLFKLAGFTNLSSGVTNALSFVLETSKARLQSKAAELGVPVTIGYAGINAWLQVPDVKVIGDDLDPFPTRYYHAGGALSHAGQKYDNVKAYAGDSGLIQEVAFPSNRIAGHLQFSYTISPFSNGSQGQQTIEAHPWVPFFFRDNGTYRTNLTLSGVSKQYATSVSGAGDVNRDGYDDVVIGDPSFDNQYQGKVSLHVGGPNGLSPLPASPQPRTNQEVSLRGLVFGGGTFVAVGDSGRILTSTNALAWSRRDSGTSNSLSGVTFGNGTLVAYGSGLILTSPDGIVWTRRESGTTNNFSSLTHGSGIFVALGASGAPGPILTSPDGSAWTRRTPGTTNRLFSATYGNGTFVVVGASGTILTSSDGATWTGRTGSYKTPGATYSLTSVTYGHGSFVAVARREIPPGTAFLAREFNILTSPDGVNWALSYSVSLTVGGLSQVYSGNGTFVARGSFTRPRGTTNGVNWTLDTPIWMDNLIGLAFGNGTLVAATSTAEFFTSTDGTVSSLRGDHSSFGWSVTGGVDINRDGYSDVIVGEPFGVSSQGNGGRVFLYLGQPTGLRTLAARIVESDQPNAGFGYSIGRAGDVNGDGYGDVVVSSPYVTGKDFRTGATIFSVGQVHLYYGAPNGFGDAPQVLHGGPSFDFRFGYCVAGAGDLNRDGFSDVIISTGGTLNEFRSQRGDSKVYVFYGSTNGLGDGLFDHFPLVQMDFNSRLGESVSSAGDLDGDGFSDVLVGAPGLNQVFLYYGGPNGLTADRFLVLRGGFGDGSKDFGCSVGSAGDVNGDGYGDVIVGAKLASNPEKSEGRVFIYLGGLNGLSTNAEWSVDGNRTNANFGLSVAGIGNVDGSGYSGVIIGTGGNSQEVATVYTGLWAGPTHAGWVRGGPGGGTLLSPFGRSSGGLTNLLPVPMVNTVNGCQNAYTVHLEYDPISNSNRISVTYNCGQSGYTVKAPFPIINPSGASQWLINAPTLYDAARMSKIPVPLDANGQTNSAFASWLRDVKLGAATNDMFIASRPGAYDVVVTNGLVDYTSVATDDPQYNPTINYVSPQTVWQYLEPNLPVSRSPSKLPAVNTLPAERPRASLSRIEVWYDGSFPTVTPDQLHLAFTDGSLMDGGENAFIRSSFSHTESGFFRAWSLTNDPNLKAAAKLEPEKVTVSMTLSNFVYDRIQESPAPQLVDTSLLDNVSMALVEGVAVAQTTATIPATSLTFQGFRSAGGLEIRIVRPSNYSTVGETESVRLQTVDLVPPLRAYSVRSARYQCEITPVISGARNEVLQFQISVKLDPLVEFSTRRARRFPDRVALPLRVIDRERFWQVDAGELNANLFREVAIETNGVQSSGSSSGYLIDQAVGYSSINGSKPLFGEPDYFSKGEALFWRTPQGTIVKNPRIVLGGISVALKDPSNADESPAFQGRRYVAPMTREYFHDLYVETNDLATLSWKVKIRPQAKEHAYIKVYGSVGGRWTLSYRRKESGQLSGLLPSDSGSLTWSTIASGDSRGQYQFLTYWDITELNGPHLLRLESAQSPDNESLEPEVKYLDIMLGQHLPGRNNPIFSPAQKPETVSVFSMHGRTQLTSVPPDRGDDDLFFTVNPMKIEERPFSLGLGAGIPLGERVQILPHTEHNPFSVNFYIDQQEYRLYDTFHLYHQLEGGALAEIASLPPSVRKGYTQINGFVEHTSFVGFLPNASLRLCTLNIPGLSPDGVIRVSGAVDLYGTDDKGQKNEDLAVAVVISTNANFYNGEVRARLTTGAKAEFPIAAEASLAMIPTSWTLGSAPRTYHLFTVVVNTNDNWLTLNRQLSAADADKHLFNLSQATVLMTTNVSNSLAVDGRPVFSPNGDGIADSVRLLADFKREGMLQLDFQNEFGFSVHQISLELGKDGKGIFTWDGLITGQGRLQVAPDGFYTVTACYANGQSADETASVGIEVRSSTKYFGRLQSSGLANNSGVWRTLWSHQGGTIFSDDLVRIQYSDTASFSSVRGERPVDRRELSALFDNTPTNLAGLQPNAEGLLQVYYRLRVDDEVGNSGFSPVVSLGLPQTALLTVTSVTPPNGATNISTEPVMAMSLAAPSPFTATELQGMFQTSPSIPVTIALSPDRRTITATPGASFPPGMLVTATLQRYQNAVSASNIVSWSFRIVPSNLINRSLTARLVGVPAVMEGIEAEATAFVVVTNRGNVPAHVSLSTGAASPNALAVSAAASSFVAYPSNELSIPLSLAVAKEYSGKASIPLTLNEATLGAWTSIVMTVSISSITSAPTLVVFSAEVQPDGTSVRLSGSSRGNGAVSTLARINNGSWWVVAEREAWSFDADSLSNGDQLEVVARDERNRISESYSYTFSGSTALLLDIQWNRSLSWDAQPGRTYRVEWSTNLLNWVTLAGQVQQAGPTVTIYPSSAPAQIASAPGGRIIVQFAPSHSAVSATKAFFRIRSDP